MLDVRCGPSTWCSSSIYLVSTGTQFPNAPRLHGEPLEIAPTSVYLIQWPQIDSERLSAQPFLPPLSRLPSGHSLTCSAFLMCFVRLMLASTVSSGWSNHFIELLNIFNIKMPLWLAYDHWTGAENRREHRSPGRWR